MEQRAKRKAGTKSDKPGTACAKAIALQFLKMDRKGDRSCL
ncbi:hypothetical protein [Scytonema hofmannii]|nr:hypothetical protein [Scytonema hofmannii]